MEQDTSGSITPIQSPSKMNQVFYNDHGLRAGWRLLIYFTMILALFSSAQLIAKRLARGAPSSVQSSPMVQAVFQVAGELVIFLVLLFLAWVMSRIERQNTGCLWSCL